MNWAFLENIKFSKNAVQRILNLYKFKLYRKQIK